jgi:hypothetical protein
MLILLRDDVHPPPGEAITGIPYQTYSALRTMCHSEPRRGISSHAVGDFWMGSLVPAAKNAVFHAVVAPSRGMFTRDDTCGAHLSNSLLRSSSTPQYPQSDRR